MRIFIGAIVLAFILAFHFPEPPESVVARVGTYVITKAEFEQAYKNSSSALQKDPLYRRAFLNNMIDQKLILLDAERRGLDHDPRFLKMVENFWQQSLLTIALQEKAKEGTDLDHWVDYLKKNTKIDIDREYLK